MVDIDRRKALAVISGGVASGIAGCNSNSDNSNPGNDSKGTISGNTPKKIETKLWRKWPGSLGKGESPYKQTAEPGKTVENLPIEYAPADGEWQQQHALMVKRGAQQIGIPTELVQNDLAKVIEGWTGTGLNAAVSFLTHSPEPVRGIDPDALLSRRKSSSLSNNGMYDNPKLDDLITKEEQELDHKKRKKLLDKAQLELATDYASMITMFPDVINAVNNKKWKGYIAIPGNGLIRDSFRWSETNLQPTGDSRHFVKATTSRLTSRNVGWKASSTAAQRLRYIYDSLFDVDPDLKTVPALATEAKQDKNTIDVTLRDGVTWHDGKPFGPDDVKFTTEMYMDNTASEMANYYTTLEKNKPVEILSTTGGGTVRFHTKSPDPIFTTIRMVRGQILPKHIWKDVKNPAKHEPKHPIGTGPFKYSSWNPGNQLDVTRNDGHWMWKYPFRKKVLGDKAKKGQGMTKLSWVNLGNVDSAIGSLTKGSTDALDFRLTPTQAERVRNHNSSQDIKVTSSKNFGPNHGWFNHMVPIIRDKEFRAAWVAHGLDLKTFVKEVMQGQAVPIPTNNFVYPDSLWYNDNVPVNKYDPEKGQNILKRAGYTKNSNGTIQYPDGKAWEAFVERIQPGNTNKRRKELGQPDFS